MRSHGLRRWKNRAGSSLLARSFSFSLLLGATFVIAAGCSSSGMAGDNEGAAGDGDVDGLGNGTGGTGWSTGAGGSIGFGGDGNPNLPDLPEEVEDDTQYRAPVATGRYLWSANPLSGRVALIDVETLSTRILPAGLFPTFLTSVGDDDSPQALVINTGSSDVTRFRVNASGGVDRDSVKTHEGANRWSTSADGKWAVAWSRPDPGVALDVTESLQEITVISLGEQMEETRLTVGYRPSQVKISSDGERLIVVTEDGITLIDLSATPTQYEWIDLGFEEEKRDVSVDDAGHYAIVRRTDHSSIDVIDLSSPDDVQEVPFPAPVTDLDLAASGRAVAVIRSRSELATFQIEDVVENPANVNILKVSGEVIGSSVLTQDGKVAVLYTNAIANDRISIVDLSEEAFLSYRSLSTKAPVYSVTTTPNGEHAVVVAGDVSTSLGEVGVPAEAFSVVALQEQRFPRIVGTAAPVAAIGLGNSFGIVTATSEVDGVHEAHLVELPGLSVRTERLASAPLSAGILSDLDLAYAAQSHPDGRVTFFDLNADSARTLTGFELSAEVVDE